MKPETMNKTPRLRYDILLISALLLVALAVSLVMVLTRQNGTYVEIELDGEIVATYSLDRAGEYVLNGGTNILVIKDGAAYLTYADCPDHRCIRYGKIRFVGQSIICLPNRLTITVRGNSDNGVDIVS